MTVTTTRSQGGTDAPADPDEVREDFEGDDLEDDAEEPADDDDV